MFPFLPGSHLFRFIPLLLKTLNDREGPLTQIRADARSPLRVFESRGGPERAVWPKTAVAKLWKTWKAVNLDKEEKCCF